MSLPSQPPDTPTGEQVLVDDIMVDILKECLQKWGPQGRSELLVLNRSISRGIYRSFYGTIRLSKAKAVRSLCKTILFHPSRLRDFKTLWAIVGPHKPLFPAFPTSSYPEGYLPVDPDEAQANGIVRNEIDALAHIVQACSAFVQNLTLVTQRRYLVLEDVLGRIALPRLTALEIPASLYLKMSPSQVPNLRQLRLSVDMDDPNNCTRFLESQDFRGFEQLRYVYIAYGNILGHENTIQVHLFDIRVGTGVRVVALEFDEGEGTALEMASMLDYVAHPCVVLVMNDRWVEDKVDRLVISHGLPAPGTVQARRVAKLRDLILGLSVEECICVWQPLEGKVAERWSSFKEHYNDDEQADVLEGPELFVMV
ncbi:hypothetical protein VNI00_014000 [Paramarasmius palmivorus]|uniref:Uncharacterized protein n=1 Tax=Paramarasmius palmivorus TaxID=297713 RepID=A0AAW0BVP6_9AGAR